MITLIFLHLFIFYYDFLNYGRYFFNIYPLCVLLPVITDFCDIDHQNPMDRNKF